MAGCKPIGVWTTGDNDIKDYETRISGLLSPPTPHKWTQRSPGVSASTLLNAAVQELIAIDRDHFNLFEAYISSVESPCTVDSTSSNLRLLPWLDIVIVSTLPPHFLYIVLLVASTPRVLYLSGYHTLFNSFRILPHILTYDIWPPGEDAVRLVLLLGEHTGY
jgi:hypothetical protein